MKSCYGGLSTLIMCVRDASGTEKAITNNNEMAQELDKSMPGWRQRSKDTH